MEEEVQYTPAVEDEEMEASGISGNEEEMAEEGDSKCLESLLLNFPPA